MEILIIDDDVNLRRRSRLTLGTMNHHVTEARNSSQAEELLGHGLFDVAFLDVRLAARTDWPSCQLCSTWRPAWISW